MENINKMWYNTMISDSFPVRFPRMEINNTTIVPTQDTSAVDTENYEEEGRFDIMSALIPELRDIIFQQVLDGRSSILKLSLVSRNWNKMVGCSKVFRKKYQFRYDSRQESVDARTLKSYDFFQNTQKCLETFTLLYKPFDAVLANFPSTNWKIGHLKEVDFNSMEQFEKFLNVIAPTIESLKLEEVSTRFVDTAPTKALICENLKVLKLEMMSNNGIKLFVNFNPKLKVLELINFEPQPCSIKLFECNPQIEVLLINEEIYNLASVHHEKFCKLKLKTLQITMESMDPLHTNNDDDAKEIKQKFKDFLISQGPTLEKLICFNVPEMPKLIFEIWNDLKQLKELCIDSYPGHEQLGFSKEHHQLNVNLNLIDLSITLQPIFPENSYYEGFINSAPKLKSVYIYLVNKDIICHAARNLKDLKKLEFCKRIEDDISFKQLMPLFKGINKELVITGGRYGPNTLDCVSLLK